MIKFFSAIISCLFLLACIQKSDVSPEDNLKAQGVIDEFIDYVESRDYEKAKGLWVGESKRILEGFDQTIPFHTFCERFTDMGDYQTSDVLSQKGVYFISVSWRQNGSQKQWRFDLKKKDGDWFLIRGYQW